MLENKKKYSIFIGIDSGVNTGLAYWLPETKTFARVQSMKIHQALELVSHHGDYVFVRVEDARKRKWLPKEKGRAQLQGAGSIKRDAVIWEDFLTDLRIDFEMVAPKNNKTKLSAAAFKSITKWPGKTNEHARDAAMLVFGM